MTETYAEETDCASPSSAALSCWLLLPFVLNDFLYRSTHLHCRLYTSDCAVLMQYGTCKVLKERHPPSTLHYSVEISAVSQWLRVRVFVTSYSVHGGQERAQATSSIIVKLADKKICHPLPSSISTTGIDYHIIRSGGTSIKKRGYH